MHLSAKLTSVNGVTHTLAIGGSYVEINLMPLAKVHSFVSKPLLDDVTALFGAISLGIRNPLHSFAIATPPADTMVLLHSSADPFRVTFGRLTAEGHLCVFTGKGGDGGKGEEEVHAAGNQWPWSHWSVAPAL